MPDHKKIKVLFRHRSMEMGGVEKVVLSMLNNLDRNKFDITLCLNMNQGELRNEIPGHIRKVFLAKGKEDLSGNKIIRNIQLVKRKIKLKRSETRPGISDKVLKDTYDVEIAPTYSVFASVLNSGNKNSKKIGWFHSDITVPKFKPLIPAVLKQIPQFDYFIFGSQQTKDILVKTYPDLKLPAHEVILNAIPIEEIKKKADDFMPAFPDKPVFASVARLHTRKGFHKLMDAHARLIREGFDHHIVIIGDGEEREPLRTQAEKLGVTGSFEFLGSLINPYPYVKNADFYILPSESEGWPLIIADTLILQKPIIATHVGGVPEMITHGQNGYLIGYETDEMYEAMKRFLTEPELVAGIQENLLYAEKQFDNRKIFEAVENIIINLSTK